jgi:hypothetical protein
MRSVVPASHRGAVYWRSPPIRIVTFLDTKRISVSHRPNVTTGGNVHRRPKSDQKNKSLILLPETKHAGIGNLSLCCNTPVNNC